ncbi:hypothetical protein [Aeromicrobium fastidiosum]|uniref:Uncharacterized protein n=1 Tax=Aeromicrobium fastidiosum TaxID=52699 RepID=A0A641ARG3_9ACTN|nr:hypothetical protein [Aeromicrobium fastidiosum]KAA1380529.1 hypothetical protein ESP62_004955 [Aeromicrobium fastidiosum]MBP2390121.1 hypothetical protein [Aeromicrobium fastidiosum]
MGIFKDAKVGSIVQEAEKAAAAGRGVFTPKLNTPASQHGLSGDIADWGLMIDGIEGAGWTLAHWTVGMDTKGRAEAYPLFRRA